MVVEMTAETYLSFSRRYSLIAFGAVLLVWAVVRSVRLGHVGVAGEPFFLYSAACLLFGTSLIASWSPWMRWSVRSLAVAMWAGGLYLSFLK
jgi:hypothetical protein